MALLLAVVRQQLPSLPNDAAVRHWLARAKAYPNVIQTSQTSVLYTQQQQATPNKLASATFAQLLLNVSRLSNATRVYFSAPTTHTNLSLLSLPASLLTNDLLRLWDPAPDLQPQDSSSLRSRVGTPLPAAVTQTYVWMGSASIATRLHYDASHNMYAQLYGHKRFWLLPPNATRHMDVYPVDSPHNRQARLPFDPRLQPALVQPSFLQTVRAAQTDALLRVDLRPGEMLILPAGWLHFVEAVTPSVSVNVWKESSATVLLQQLLRNALPFGDRTWSADKIAVGLQRYLPWVLNRVLEYPIHDESTSDWTPSALHGWLRSWHPDGQVLDTTQCSASRANGLHVLLKPYVDDVVRTFISMKDEGVMQVLLWVWMHSSLSLLHAKEKERVSFLLKCIAAT
eukprot:m.269467 g.269467  ORF g.269467 m.269467 type:complete len:398 (+) comp17661_c1_seq48:1421-2614(+)